MKVSELPEDWRARLQTEANAHVTVRIEEEQTVQASTEQEFVTDDPAFGIWRDRSDMNDVTDYVRYLRAPRYNPDGSRNGPSR